jgi:uncharacterized ion transporter superfamily protein YfcC
MPTNFGSRVKRKTRYLTKASNWRDLVLFLTTVLFVVIAWNADHHKWHWLPVFSAAILMSVVTAFIVLRGIRTAVHEHNQRDHP